LDDWYSHKEGNLDGDQDYLSILNVLDETQNVEISQPSQIMKDFKFRWKIKYIEFLNRNGRGIKTAQSTHSLFQYKS
jgi:hypothetical protein